MLTQYKKTEIENQVLKALKNFARNKGLTKKKRKFIDLVQLLKKIELAEEFCIKCKSNIKITSISKEEDKFINQYFKIHLDKAVLMIIKEYS